MSASKVQTLQQRAQEAYDTDYANQGDVQVWFNSLPDIDLGVLWGLACSEGVAYDDEVFEALDRRGWFEEER